MPTAITTLGRNPSSTMVITDTVKWRHSNLWSRYNLYVVGQHDVLCEVK